MKKKAVVFGGSGFLGSHMIDYLLEEEYEVTSFDLAAHPSLDKNNNIIGDILDTALVDEAVRGANVVFNYAAIADIEECIKDPVKAVKTNIMGNVIVLDACAKHKVGRYMFASSVYTESLLGGIYSSTKVASESLIKDYNKYHGVNYSILRYGTVYGPGSNCNNSVYRFLEGALQNKKIVYQGTGDERREYIHVMDAARLSFLSLKEEHKNSTLILTGHKSLKVKDLFAIIREILGDDIRVEFGSQENEQLLKSHYKTTPYSYSRDLPVKLVGAQHIDIGAGLLQCIKEQDNERNK